MVRIAALVCLLAAACFNPTFNNPTCGPQGECPSGTTCVNGTCRAEDDGGMGEDATDASDGSLPDDGGDGGGNPDAASFAVAYLPASASTPGTGDWTIGVATLIDTTLLTANPNMPAGVTLTMSAQTDANAPAVAVLHVNKLVVGAGATLTVRGMRPLAIVAGDEVELTGQLNAGAVVVTPGPGGYMTMSGFGSGQSGTSNGVFNDDSGGGGGGRATTGAPGGDAQQNLGGMGGSAFGGSPPTGLYGGGGGGIGGFDGACMMPLGGSGGGGILIASATGIRINSGGGVNVGGGGGAGGTNCSSDAPGGGGGGAGGQIDLQAPAYMISTTQVFLAANGGGGGGGGMGGTYGLDGAMSSTPAAGGLAGGGSSPTDGGAGAAGGMSPQPGESGGVNTGGGGGAAGRAIIHYRGTMPSPIVSSPPAAFVAF